ncbi:Hok/Gef family protein [Escherichia coli]
MSQKSLITVTICMTVIFTIWMIHNSHCEFRLNIMWSQFAAFLQCKQ